MQIHIIECPNCANEYYTRIPEEVPEVKESEGCTACPANLNLEYQEADDEDIEFEIEVEITNEQELENNGEVPS